MAYVIKSWKASHTPGPGGVYIEIIGRKGGLIAWLLSLIGMSPTVKFVVREDTVDHGVTSWSGFAEWIVPNQKISSVVYGCRRPWVEAVLILVAGFVVGAGIASLFTVARYVTAGGIAFFIIALLGIGGAIAYFILNKTLTLGVIEVGGVAHVIGFKRSVIEGQNISEDDAVAVAEIIRKRLDKANVVCSPGQTGIPPSQAPVVPTCPDCGRRYGSNEKFCRGCGRQLSRP